MASVTPLPLAPEALDGIQVEQAALDQQAARLKATGDPAAEIFAVLWSNRHRSFNSARGNKAFWPNGHLKGDATTNTLISYGYSGIWWRLLHNTGYSQPWRWP